MMRFGKAVGGSIIVLLGLVFLLNNFGMIPAEVWKYWPLILVFLGVAIIFSQQMHHAEEKKAEEKKK
ncbi:Uncharacterised protein [Candidatus Anstonella stagnisolia]|nr:Uncharacterised protein [Candidatus Anstonella stagnisolia]